jgi:hypothetical protein
VTGLTKDSQVLITVTSPKQPLSGTNGLWFCLEVVTWKLGWGEIDERDFLIFL